MNKVNLKKLAKKGTKQIFLLHTSFAKYGEKKVLKWIKKPINMELKCTYGYQFSIRTGNISILQIKKELITISR